MVLLTDGGREPTHNDGEIEGLPTGLRADGGHVVMAMVQLSVISVGGTGCHDGISLK